MVTDSSNLGFGRVALLRYCNVADFVLWQTGGRVYVAVWIDPKAMVFHSVNGGYLGDIGRYIIFNDAHRLLGNIHELMVQWCSFRVHFSKHLTARLLSGTLCLRSFWYTPNTKTVSHLKAARWIILAPIGAAWIPKTRSRLRKVHQQFTQLTTSILYDIHINVLVCVYI